MKRMNRLALALVAAFVLSIMNFGVANAAPAATKSPAAKTSPAAKATTAKSMSQEGTIGDWDAKAKTFTLSNGGKSWKMTWTEPVGKKGNTMVMGKPANGASAKVWYTGAAEPYTATKIQVAKAAAPKK